MGCSNAYIWIGQDNLGNSDYYIYGYLLPDDHIIHYPTVYRFREYLPGSTPITEFTQKDIFRLEQQYLALETKCIADLVISFNLFVYNKIDAEAKNLYNTLLNVSNYLSSLIYNSQTNTLNSIADTKAGILAAITTDIIQTAQYIDAAESSITNSIVANTANIQENVNQSTEYIVSRLSGDINSAESSVLNAISSIENVVSDGLFGLDLDLNGLVDELLAGLSGIIDGISTKISGSVESVIVRIETAFKAVKDAVFTFSQDTFMRLVAPLEDLQSKLKQTFTYLSSGATELEVVFKALSATITSGQINSWDDLETYMESEEILVGQLKSALLIFQALPTLYKVSELLVRPFLDHLGLLTQEKSRAALLPDGVILEAFKRGKIDTKSAIEQLGLLGYADERSKVLFQLIENLLDENTLRQLFLRGMIDETTLDKRLHDIGYIQENIEQIKGLYELLPPVQDLITMAVREVFTPDIATKYGIFEDYPVEFEKHAKSIGLTSEWSKNYWAAHWQLPSPMQGYFMFHRRLIDRDDLEQLLRSLDYMPFWRDKLIDLSYSPLTRVDVRRMHAEGVLNRGQVYDSYLDVGYSPENAERMTEFTVRYNADSGDGGSNDIRQLTRSIIERAYLQGVITRDIALERLEVLGYTTEDSTLLLEMIELKQGLDYSPDATLDISKKMSSIIIKSYIARSISYEEALEGLKANGYGGDEATAILTLSDTEHDMLLKIEYVSAVKDSYFRGIVSKPDLMENLNVYGFSANEIDTLIAELDMFKGIKTRQLTRADLRKAYQGEVIDLYDYITELYNLGYPDRYIAIILSNEGINVEEE